MQPALGDWTIAGAGGAKGGPRPLRVAPHPRSPPRRPTTLLNASNIALVKLSIELKLVCLVGVAKMGDLMVVIGPWAGNVDTN